MTITIDVCYACGVRTMPPFVALARGTYGEWPAKVLICPQCGRAEALADMAMEAFGVEPLDDPTWSGDVGAEWCEAFWDARHGEDALKAAAEYQHFVDSRIAKETLEAVKALANMFADDTPTRPRIFSWNKSHV